MRALDDQWIATEMGHLPVAVDLLEARVTAVNGGAVWNSREIDIRAIGRATADNSRAPRAQAECHRALARPAHQHGRVARDGHQVRPAALVTHFGVRGEQGPTAAIATTLSRFERRQVHGAEA